MCVRGQEVGDTHILAGGEHESSLPVAKLKDRLRWMFVKPFFGGAADGQTVQQGSLPHPACVRSHSLIRRDGDTGAGHVFTSPMARTRMAHGRKIQHVPEKQSAVVVTRNFSQHVRSSSRTFIRQHHKTKPANQPFTQGVYKLEATTRTGGEKQVENIVL